MDPIARFLRLKTVRRGVVLAAFVGVLVVFRHLAPLLVFFVLFSRSLDAAADFLHARLGIPRKVGVLACVAFGLGGLGTALAFGVGRSIRAVIGLRDTLPAKIALVRETPLFQQVQEKMGDADKYVDQAKHYATGAVHFVTAFGHILLYALIGLIIAIIYLLEEAELRHWYKGVDPKSIGGTLIRWMGHLSDAVVLTLQLQLIVAGCNAIFTLPILLGLGIPHAGALSLFIFACSLIPVVGNLLSGAVLILLAHHSRGWVGVGIFVVLTFVLHKIESYYLNPRLTARHVRLPGFVLIASLIAWEHLLGIVGLFVSFPFLFIVNRIRAEMIQEDDADRVAAQEAAAATAAAAEAMAVAAAAATAAAAAATAASDGEDRGAVQLLKPG